jgi:two-component system, OmpR family, response regulator
MRVVIVEDDALVGDAVRRALLRAGFDVEHTHTGGAGLEALERCAFDLAVIDIDLPDVDGIAVVHEMRRRGQTLPALMLSAHDGAAQRERALAGGASDYLTKPFAVSELIARCRAQLQKAAPEATELSACHRRILERLSRELGRIVSRDRLAHAAECAPGDLEAQVAQLREKLKAPARIRQVRGLGYRID